MVGVPTKTRLGSSIKTFNAHLIYAYTLAFQAGHTPITHWRFRPVLYHTLYYTALYSIMLTHWRFRVSGFLCWIRDVFWLGPPHHKNTHWRFRPVLYHPSNLMLMLPRQIREVVAIGNQWRWFDDVVDLCQ